MFRKWTWWRADGTVESKVEYQDGQVHGISVKLAEDGSVLERTEFEHGNPVTGSVGEPAPIPEPADISCPSIARRVDELAQAEMGAGIPEEKRESLEKAMKTMKAGLEVSCSVHLSKVQRLCFMVAPRIAAMRWCQGPGPQRCEEAFAHMMSLIEESDLSADDLKQARGELSLATRGCMAEGAMTEGLHTCIMGTKTPDDIDSCADMAPGL